MKKDFLPFSKPSISGTDIRTIAEVLRSGWTNTVTNCATPEHKFCEYTVISQADALTFSTARMHIVLETLSIGSGDEVITQSLTWVSTGDFIYLMGVTPVFADVDGIHPMGLPKGYGYKHAWHLFVVRVDSEGLSSDRLMTELNKLNIGTGLHFRHAHGQKYSRKRSIAASDGLLNTEWNTDRICSIPLFPDMADSDLNDVVNAITTVVDNG